MKKCLVLPIIIGCFFYASATFAQGLSHTPLKGIFVRLRSIGAESIELHATTEADGSFSFGWVPPGVYALGCAYTACYTAFHETKHSVLVHDQADTPTNSSEDPELQISVNACEGMMCRVAVGKMMPDDWSSNVKPSTKTTITKEWSNTTAWLKSGGGVTLKIDGAHSTVSGKIEAQ